MPTDQPTSPAELAAALKKSLTEHWRLFLAEGVVLVVLGVAAIIIPPLAGLATTIILGWLFLIGGIVGLVTTFGAHQAPGSGGRCSRRSSRCSRASSCCGTRGKASRR